MAKKISIDEKFDFAEKHPIFEFLCRPKPSVAGLKNEKDSKKDSK